LIRTRLTSTQLLQLAFVAIFVTLGWNPVDRHTWLIENSLVLVGAAFVWFARHRFYWTPVSWAQVVLFLCLHQVGTHYTYPQVPYDQAFAALTGISIDQTFGWQRNQYDRLVHLFYGLLWALPLREILTRQCALKGAWASLMAWSLVLSTSMLYELMEWLGGSNSSFVGAQGDFWDAQKDMAIAAAGSLVVLICRGHLIREKISWVLGRHNG